MTSSRSQVLLSSLRIVLVGLIAVLVLAFYVQTRHGFRHIILPLISKTLPPTFTIRDGYLRLRGSLELEGFHYGDETSGVTIEAERVFVSLSLLSLLRERIPLLHEVQIERATVSLSAADKKSADSGETTPSPTGAAPSIAPMVIERGLVEDLTVVIRDGQRMIAAEGATLRFNQLGPGRQGSLGLCANLRLDQPPEEIPWLGSVTLEAALEVNDAGTEVRWTGSNRFGLKERRAGPTGTEPEVILVDQTFAGKYHHASRAVQASSRFTTSKGKVALGSAAVTVAMTDSENVRTLDASLTVQDVSGEVLNAWQVGSSPTRSYSGLINGQVFVHAIGPLYEVRSQLMGRHLQMRSETGTTPPLDLSLKQETSFEAQSRALLVKSLDLTASHGTRSMLTGTLDQPLKLLLKQEQVGTVVANGGTAEGTGLALRIQDLEVADLRAWAAFLGRETAGDVGADPLNGTLRMTVDASGSTVHLDGQLRVTNVLVDSATGAVRVGPLGFDHRVHARLTNLTRLELDPWTSIVTLKDRTVGEFRATGLFEVAAPTEPLTLEGSLTLRELPGEALNPVVAFWKPVRILGARFRGHATWKLAEHRISWEADLRGRHVSLQPPHFATVTPPLDLAMAQSGTYDQTTGELRLVKSNVQAVEKGRVVVSAALSHPVDLQFAGREARPTSSPLGNQPVTFAMDIDGLDVEQLKSRLLVMDISAMETVKGGLLNGRLEARWHGTGNRTVVTGGLTATGLRFQRGATRSGGPVSMTARGNVTIGPDARIEWSDCHLVISAAKQEIAAVKVAGLTAVTDGVTDLAFNAGSGDLSMLLDRLALLEEQQRRLVTGGLIRLEGKVAGSGRGQPLSIQTSMHTDNLRIRARQAGSASYSIAARGDLSIDGSRTRLEVKQLGMRLESDGRQSGSASMSGQWPLTSAGLRVGATSVSGGAVKATVKDWDAAPFADLYDLLPGRMKGPLPVNADIKLEHDPRSGIISVQGLTLLGPIRVLRKGGDIEEGVLRLDHELVLSDDEIRATSMTITRERSHGSDDRLTLSGIVRWGKQARTQLKSEIVSLDTGWYEDLFAVPGAQTDRPGPPLVARDKRPGDRRETYGFGDQQDFHAEVTLGTILYKGVTIGPGRLIAEGAGDRSTVTLEPTDLVHGKIQGRLAIAGRDGESEYSWTVRGDGLDVGILSRANQSGSEPTVTGIGSFTTNGIARGKGEALKQGASGTAVWDVVKGKFANASLLAFISKHTGIKGLEDMNFDLMHGELRLSEGWIFIDRVGVDGSLAKLDGMGKIGWNGTLDGRVSTRITPALADKVRIRCVTGLLRGADGLFALPVVVAVKGTVSAPEYNVELTGEKAKSAAGSLSDLLRGCREDSPQPETAPAPASTGQ